MGMKAVMEPIGALGCELTSGSCIQDWGRHMGAQRDLELRRNESQFSRFARSYFHFIGIVTRVDEGQIRTGSLE